MPRRPHRPWYDNVPFVAILAGVLAIATLAVVVAVNPWPSAMLIRSLFEKGAADTVSEMQPYVPATGVDARTNISYGDAGVNTTFDVFSPTGATTPLTTVVWVHGGAWISGDKEGVEPYARILASHGFVVVALNYTVAPEATYPVALDQLNSALGVLTSHADEYGIDPDRIVLAGDSAGSQYVSQLATAVTNPSYARRVGVTPALTPAQLRAVILNCGIYDVSGIPNTPGIGGWGFRVALWSYLGTKNWSTTPGGEAMSTIDFVTKDFPRTWISGGNADPLTATQSKPFAAKLSGVGVPVTTLFYPDDETPELPHEYQFHLKLAAARSALDSTVAFLNSVAAS